MSVNASLPSATHCSDSRAAQFILAAFIVTKIFLVLPLCVLVLYLGHQRWRRQRSFATTSHSDVFTYHMSAVELISASGGALYFWGFYSGVYEMIHVGLYICPLIFPGQMFLHTLTCVERYLAVVHPVTYLGLRQSGGVKLRNGSAACVWLLCLGWVAPLRIRDLTFEPFFCVLVFCLIVVSFCSLSVLWVLIRPRPREVGGDREQVDQSKRRAFHTVVAIMGVLWLWFGGFLACLALNKSQLLSYSDACVLLTNVYWFTLPSSLVLPLLFLHRAGKLPVKR